MKNGKTYSLHIVGSGEFFCLDTRLFSCPRVAAILYTSYTVQVASVGIPSQLFDQFLRRERRQGNIHFPSTADHG